ncbi:MULTISPECIES: GntR family transcriptional regulator [unclassified Devosia]|uniref:GntR family transcriptional regulator n=1 Tax=unclassified Devosia TaxID=196773 RepID=UPI0009E9A475|nr:MULTISPECIES: GntR family transcriptional regulator [unclassified Devosia]
MKTPIQESPSTLAASLGLARPHQAERRTNAAVIHDALYKSIARMELRPGEPLQEKALTELFGVSRTPVREALVRLQGEGLVDMQPQAGTSVALIPKAAIRESIIIRRGLEQLAVTRLAAVANERDIARLDLLIAQQRLAVSIDDQVGFHDADEEFHELIALAAGFSMLWPMVRQMKVHLDRLRVLSLPLEGRMGVTVDEHQRIRDAIAARDVEAASNAMHDHLGVMIPYIDHLSSSYPDYFVNAREAHRVPTI